MTVRTFMPVYGVNGMDKERQRIAFVISILIVLPVFLFYILRCITLSDSSINGFTGYNAVLRMKITGVPYVKLTDQPLQYLVPYPSASMDGGPFVDALNQLADTDVVMTYYCEGYAQIGGKYYRFGGGAFTSHYWHLIFTPSDRKKMVGSYIDQILIAMFRINQPDLENYGKVKTFGDLNLTADQYSEIRNKINEKFGVELSEEQLNPSRSKEDIVDYIDGHI